MYMRVPSWMIFGLIITILLLDLTTIWMIRGKVISAVEHSLDAALVAGIVSIDVQRGELFVNEEEGKNYARSYFKKNLNLNASLENQFLKDTKFTIEFNHDGKRPQVVANIKTYIQAMAPKVLGMEGIPITIHKVQYHISKYK